MGRPSGAPRPRAEDRGWGRKAGPVRFEVAPQETYGVFLFVLPVVIASGEIPPVPPNGSYRVVFEVPLADLPPSAEEMFNSAPGGPLGAEGRTQQP